MNLMLLIVIVMTLHYGIAYIPIPIPGGECACTAACLFLCPWYVFLFPSYLVLVLQRLAFETEYEYQISKSLDTNIA